MVEVIKSPIVKKINDNMEGLEEFQHSLSKEKEKEILLEFPTV